VEQKTTPEEKKVAIAKEDAVDANDQVPLEQAKAETPKAEAIAAEPKED